MHTRDAQGRQVSLLNEEPPTYYRQGIYLHASHQSGSGSSLSSSSEPPVMLRSNSYDSDGSGDPTSPMTPGIYDPARASLDAISASSSRHVGMISSDRMYDEYPPTESCTSSATKRIVETPKTSSCDEDGSANTSSAQERPGRRYPCRFRDTHGCDKTFTTSGHASRHSKIHTAEKAVHCTYPNCHKKFTRADNMKQHLETHYKDKSRAGGSRSTGLRAGAVPMSGGSRRHPAISRGSASSAHHASHQHRHHRGSHDGASVISWDGSQYGAYNAHVPSDQKITSPVSRTAWDMTPLDYPLMIKRGPNSGLDALALAIACQEGGGSGR